MLGAAGGGIRFGNNHFSALALLPWTSQPRIAELPGLYVVLAYDSNWTPRPFRPLYFGESHDPWGRANAEHEKYESWRAAAGVIAPLYRGLCLLPGSTRSQRQAAESALIAEYSPPCNERLSVSLGALLGVR